MILYGYGLYSLRLIGINRQTQKNLVTDQSKQGS